MFLRRSHTANAVVVLGDGAPWLGQIATRQFTGAVQIVDFFHAVAPLAKVAQARFGKDTPHGNDWLQTRQEELKSDQLSRGLADLQAWKPTSVVQKPLRQSTYAYVQTNAPRMRDKTFLEAGYHIGSGDVEATCNHVVAQRLDQAGMHWRQESAGAMVALRAAQLSTCPLDLRPYCAMPACYVLNFKHTRRDQPDRKPVPSQFSLYLN